MDYDQIRRRVCFEAAQMLKDGRETNPTRAKWLAARSVTRSWLPPSALPEDREIRWMLAQLKGEQALPMSTQDSTLVDDRGSGGADAPWKLFRYLLQPLEHIVRRDPAHPEGDVLYHCLQVYDCLRQQIPWDDEIQLAGLLHDAGLGIDRLHPTEALLSAVEEHVSPRVSWLIEHLPLMSRIGDGTIGRRALRRMRSAPDWDDLESLYAADQAGRVSGAEVPSLDEALSALADLQRNSE